MHFTYKINICTLLRITLLVLQISITIRLNLSQFFHALDVRGKLGTNQRRGNLFRWPVRALHSTHFFTVIQFTAIRQEVVVIWSFFGKVTLEVRLGEPRFVYLNVWFSFLQGNFDSAETEVRLALRHDANSKDGEFILGRILEIKGSLKEAREHYHKVLKMDYRHSGALSALQRINNKTVNYIGAFADVNPW